MHMTEQEVYEFILGNSVDALDPDSLQTAANINYHADGSIKATFADGSTDTGQYGFTEHYYWTRYTKFRDGTLNEFYLVRSGVNEAQAYYKEGSRAFLQRIVSQ